MRLIPSLSLLLLLALPLRAEIVTITFTDEWGNVATVNLTVDDASRDIVAVEGTEYSGRHYSMTLAGEALTGGWGSGPKLKWFRRDGASYSVWVSEDGRFTGAIRYGGGTGYPQTEWLYRAPSAAAPTPAATSPTVTPDHR